MRFYNFYLSFIILTLCGLLVSCSNHNEGMVVTETIETGVPPSIGSVDKDNLLTGSSAVKQPQGEPPVMVRTMEKADVIGLACDDAGVTVESICNLSCALEQEENCYNLTFEQGGKSYCYQVDANTGAILYSSYSKKANSNQSGNADAENCGNGKQKRKRQQNGKHN